MIWFALAINEIYTYDDDDTENDLNVVSWQHNDSSSLHHWDTNQVTGLYKYSYRFIITKELCNTTMNKYQNG